MFRMNKLSQSAALGYPPLCLCTARGEVCLYTDVQKSIDFVVRRMQQKPSEMPHQVADELLVSTAQKELIKKKN